jgi:hypothetical protein
MTRKLLPIVLTAVLALGACMKGGVPTDPTSPGDGVSTGAPGSLGNDPSVSDDNWTNPDGSIPQIVPIDPAVDEQTGTGTVGVGGSVTSLVFETSGTARFNEGTCSGSVSNGTDGTWTDADGVSHGAHNANCLGYFSDGRVGNNGKGTCVTSPEGYAGLWLNPGGHATSPYHSKCLQKGATTSGFALTFTAQAIIYTTNDGTGTRTLDFDQGDSTVAQLVYHGSDDTTTGAGVLRATDNGAMTRTWTIGLAQPALNYQGGAANGDMIAELQGAGVPVVGCNPTLGCAMVTLQLGATP